MNYFSDWEGRFPKPSLSFSSYSIALAWARKGSKKRFGGSQDEFRISLPPDH